jgi:BirA family biotin operon repressor/biotin-[acetyl-CoA-carboxylase] ligase
MSSKDLLLGLLKERRGAWVSGEVLCKSMAISRSAVWKQVCKLKGDGYVIEASPRKGYLFLETSHMVLPNDIRETLSTKVFGQREIVHVTETDSTNTVAKALASRGAPEGTLVIAESQKKGRGRKGRSWYSPPLEGIYASLVLRPGISPGDAPKMTFMTAVAVAEALSSKTALKVDVKWPNDILVNRKKVAGILTEISMEMDAIEYMVIGLCLNVNTAAFPDDIKEKATSILLQTGRPFSRSGIVREYLQHFERYYEQFTRSGPGPMIERWRALSDMNGRKVSVDVIDRTYTGIVQEIDDDGVLILKDRRGRSYRIFSGDVHLI